MIMTWKEKWYKIFSIIKKICTVYCNKNNWPSHSRWLFVLVIFNQLNYPYGHRLERCIPRINY